MSDVPTKSLDDRRAQTPHGHDGRQSPGSCAIPACRAAQGLYDPSNEQDSCGVGFIADMKNRKSHAIVEQGLRS